MLYLEHRDWRRSNTRDRESGIHRITIASELLSITCLRVDPESVQSFLGQGFSSVCLLGEGGALQHARGTLSRVSKCHPCVKWTCEMEKESDTTCAWTTLCRCARWSSRTDPTPSTPPTPSLPRPTPPQPDRRPTSTFRPRSGCGSSCSRALCVLQDFGAYPSCL